MTTEQIFGEWLRRRRVVLGMTQTDLAARVGYDPDYVRRMEGREKAPKAMAQALVAGLEIPDDLRAAFLQFALGGRYDHQLDRLIGLAVTPAPSAPSLPSVGRLPSPLTGLVGREQEVSGLTRLLLRPEIRLVTLTGPGGTGKTRVALQAAADLRVHFPDGVWFVDLAPIGDPTQVDTAVTKTLRLTRPGARSPREVVLDHLERRRALLVFDNWEQLLPSGESEGLDAARSLLNEVRHYCEGVKLLVTSRQPLNLRGEKLVTVPQLEPPDLQRPISLEHLQKNDAVRLFVARARDVDDGFALTNQNALAVAEICARLDGLPLAIELAAPRVARFSPQAMRDDLARHGLRVLTGPDDLPERQLTLERTFDWSYRLLEPTEQSLLRRLAVFVGGCTLGAAATVLEQADIQAQVSVLARHQLVRWHDNGAGDGRVGMLQTIHDCALARLRETDELPTLQQRHAAYFANIAAEIDRLESGEAFESLLQGLDDDHANVRASMDWYAQPDADLNAALHVAGNMLWFWLRRSYPREGHSYLVALLERAPAVANETWARALDSAGILAYQLDDYAAGREYAQRAVALAR